MSWFIMREWMAFIMVTIVTMMAIYFKFNDAITMAGYYAVATSFILGRSYVKGKQVKNG